MIDLDPVLMISVFALFVFMLFSLNSIYFKPVLKHIDARNASLKQSQEYAAKTMSDAGLAEQECENILKEAKKEAGLHIGNVIKEEKAKNERLLNEEKEKLKAQTKLFQEDLEKEKKAIEKLLQENSDLLKEAIKSKMVA
ncbi:MAG: F0F1 ATP synthase subunit B family protein [Helicobacteraceae bacterium]